MRAYLSTSLIASLLVTAWLAPPTAHAQNGGNFEINAFRPAMDSHGYITLNGSQVLQHGYLSFGLVTNWGRNLLRFSEGPNSYAVDNFVSPTLIGAIGLNLGGLEMELGTSVPFHVMQGERDPDFVDPADPNMINRFGFEGQGLGDIGVHLKWRVLNTSLGRKIGLAFIGSGYLPTATESDRFLGEQRFTPQLMAVVDKDWGRQKEIRAAVNAGVRLRTSQLTFVDDQGGDLMPPLPTTGRRVAVGSTLPVGVAIAYAIVPHKFDVVGEIFGELPLGGENFFPLEAVAGVKLYLAHNSFLTIGGGAGLMRGSGGSPDARAFIAIVFEPKVGDRDGDGIPDDIDQCPDEPEDFDGFEDEDGCPDPDNDQDGIPDVDDHCPNEPGPIENHGCPYEEEADRDGDGIPDHLDLCPDEPEDYDGFEDEDGCPDPDNDGDGILDIDDMCPNEPEDFDGFEDEDGCPEDDNDGDGILDFEDLCPNEPGFAHAHGCPARDRVVVTATSIEILDKIFFEYNSDTIKSESFPILNAVATTLEGNPDILKVEIQGHTDQRGSAEYNLDLSDRRAKSVRQYLINKGIDAARLEGQGYGKSQLLDERDNEEAWAKNRRVEFLILKRAGQ